jgi:serine phosphatase RsbU (regulator of sigma subunit)
MTYNPKILIVDDEPLNIDYLEQELDDMGYATISAVNGQDALDKVQAESPDLVLLDIMMPVMDGFSVLAKMKADPSMRDIPVIIISAMTDLESVVRGVEQGADDYLPKPFQPTLLQARISSSLDRKRLRDHEQLYLKSLEHELNIAREIQKEFLPLELPASKNWEVGAFFKAANEVAGDFYDAFTLPNGNMICLIGDVCGKGVGAALFMTLFRSLIRATSTSSYFSNDGTQSSFTPTEQLLHAVSFTNNYVAVTHEESNMFATMFICLLDVESGTLSYINAGNEAAFLLRKDGVLEELKPSGPVVGIMANGKFSVREINMKSNDILLTFTDGIPDCENPKGEFFGHERIRELLKQEHSNPVQCVNLIAHHLEQFVDTAKQFDDITILAIKKN